MIPVSQTDQSGKQFDADGAILNSLANLKVDLAVQSSVKLDQCEYLMFVLNIDSEFIRLVVAADLAFAQNGVPAVVSFLLVLFVSYLNDLAKVDKTALFLIGAVAGPIAQNLVDGSVLAFSQADIS